MSLLHLYSRVLALLGPQKKLGVFLALANFALAGAMFAEPVLFGRIIDALAGAQAKGATAAWPDLIKLIAAWVAFGLFTIVGGRRHRAVCRPPRPPAPPGGADRLFRSCAAAAADCSTANPIPAA